MSRSRLLLVGLAIAMFGLASCSSKAETVSNNLSKAADQFEIQRRVVFFNGITDEYLLTVEGLCSIESDNEDRQLEVTCKVAENEYKKHFLGLSDNVSYFVEQLETADASEYRYRVLFRPSVIVPDIDLDIP